MFKCRQHAPGHLAVCAACNPQVDCRCWHAQLGEKHVGHIRIAVLSGMDDDFAQGTANSNRTTERRRLDELGSRPDNR